MKRIVLIICFLLVASAVGIYAMIRWEDYQRFGINYYAKDCIYSDDTPDWSFRSFYNKCNYDIFVKYCSNYAAREVLNLLSGGDGNPRLECEGLYGKSGRSFKTIKWTNEQSSISSHVLSTSRYTMSACAYPRTPVMIPQTGTKEDRLMCSEERGGFFKGL